MCTNVMCVQVQSYTVTERARKRTKSFFIVKISMMIMMMKVGTLVWNWTTNQTNKTVKLTK